mgnify:CR=1 FL=1
MAYNPALYSPYGMQLQPQQMQPAMPAQPSNGLVWIDTIEGAQMYRMAPDSVSPPLLLKDEDAFIVKTTDGGGAATLKKFSFTEVPLTEEKDSELYVTKEYLDKWGNQMMEAINGKRTASEQSNTNKQ